jgi:hypothetical protein
MPDKLVMKSPPVFFALVSHRLPLSKVHEGIELLRQGKGLKIILEPEEY